MNIRKRKVSSWGMLGVLAGVTALCGAIGLAAAQGEPTSSAHQSRGVVLDPWNRPEVYNQLSPEKKAEQDALNRNRNRALEHPVDPNRVRDGSTFVTPTPIPNFTPSTDHDLGAGVLRDLPCWMDFVPKDFEGTNHWNLKVETGITRVCAGGAGPELRQGAVFLQSWNAKGTKQVAGPNGIFPTPGEHGQVAIVASVEDVLTLRAADGTLFYFDVSTLSYVDAPKPDATPGPR